MAPSVSRFGLSVPSFAAPQLPHHLCHLLRHHDKPSESRKPLRCTVSDNACKSTVDLDGEVSLKVGAKLFNDYSSTLEPFCQMGYRRHGEAIMQVCSSLRKSYTTRHALAPFLPV